MLSQEHVRNTAANRVDMCTIGANHFSFRYVNLSVKPMNNVPPEGHGAMHEETLRLADSRGNQVDFQVSFHHPTACEYPKYVPDAPS